MDLRPQGVSQPHPNPAPTLTRVRLAPFPPKEALGPSDAGAPTRSRWCPGASRALIGGLLALILPSASPGQSGDALIQRLDSIAGAKVRENRSVGIVAAVVKGKDTLLLEAYGKADVESGASLTTNTVIPIGSVTKQFTAAAILQLRDQGKLSLDDEITKWLPDFGAPGRKVTLRHLLGHTAGVVELGEMPELRAMKLIRNPDVSRDSVYRIIVRYPFRFPAGTMQRYSNTGFWLLGRIVEKASGMRYEDYIEKKIFEPLGMSRSMYCDPAKNVADRAYGHGIRNGNTGRVPDIVHTATFAAGAICSTVGDMIKWLAALHGGKVLTPRSYAEMIAPSKLSDGTPTQYSLGLTVGEDSHGLQYIGHSGGGFGFSSEVRWYPGGQLAVVVLTNSEPDEITATAEGLVTAVLPAPRSAGPFKGDASLLIGSYQGPGRGKEMVIEVTQTPEGIAISIDGAAATLLEWIESWRFRRGGSLVMFRRDGNSGRASELRFDTIGDYFILKRK